MNTGKILRMRRFFKGGKTIIVPMDHALYNGPMPGIEDLTGLVKTVASAGADGILTTPGMLDKFGEVIGELAVVLRIDGTHTRLGSHLERIDLITTVENAVRLGVEMVVVNIFVGAENEDKLLGKLGSVATACREWGMPLMGEMIPVSTLQHHYAKGGKEKDVKKTAEDIKLVSRLGAEIGADVIKTHYTGTVESFREVVETAPVPIVIAGGPKTDTDQEFLQQIKEAMQAGAAGICIGRNVWQRGNPKAMIKALSAIIHDGAGVNEAEKLLK